MDFQQNEQLSINEIFTRIKAAYSKYWYLAWPPALATLLLIIVIALKLPSYYTSAFSVHIQPQQINSAMLGNSQGKNQDSFAPLIEELRSRPRIKAIIQKLQLYPDLIGFTGQEKALDKFRKAYSIQTIETFKSSNNAPVMFRVSFSHDDREKVFRVADELQNLFVQESLINVRSETRGKEEFFRAQLKEIEKDIEDNEKRRERYLRQNPDKLPKSRERAIRDLREAKNRYALNQRKVEANKQRIRYLQRERELSIQDPSTTSQNPNSLFDSATNLGQLERSLEILSNKYSSKHPEVIALKRRIQTLKKRVKSEGGSGDATSFGNTRESRAISREMSELEVEMKVAESENIDLEKNIKRLERNIEASPIKEKELLEIDREYESLKENYDNIMLDLQRAKLELDLIQSQRGTRFKIIEPPSKPERPAGPPRLIILAGGIFAGIFIFISIPLAFYYLNSSLKFKNEAENVLSVPVIGMIPPLNTPTVIKHRRKATTTSIITSGATLVLGIIVILAAV